MRSFLALSLLLAGCAASTGPLPATTAQSIDNAAIARAVSASTRTPANTARDGWRHPAETLAFFDVKPGDTVVELWPGGGWYTEVLAPLTAGTGTLYAAGPWERGLNGVKKLQQTAPAIYGAVKLAAFPATEGAPGVPDGVADVVLTFRNIHNWRFGGEDQAAAMFVAAARMLKPGGVMGVVEHRLPEERDAAGEEKSGYLKTSTVVALAQQAGLRLAAQSDVNANAKDSADWPDGVWTLPPTYQRKDIDRARYAAIGESDRMTLKFLKPAG